MAADRNILPATGARAVDPRRIALTERLIRARHPHPRKDHPRSHRDLSPALFTALLERALQRFDDRDGLWVFAYGSLLWNPAFEPAASRIATVHGLSRRFCLWQWRSRGSPEQPGLMLALDRGGSSVGVVQHVGRAEVREQVEALWRREMRGNGYRARWVRARTGDGPVTALTFVANRGGERYAGRLADHEVAFNIARGCGSRGACAEYLRRTVLELESLGIRDRHLWRLQGLVAHELAHGD